MTLDAILKTQFSPLVYVLLLIIIVVIASIILLIKKLKYSPKQILKYLGSSLLITILIGTFLFLMIIIFPSLFIVYDASALSVFISLFLRASPFIFLIVLLVYLIIKVVKKKK